MSETPTTPDPAPDPPVPPVPDYVLGWGQGVADAGATLVGCVASWLGYDTPLTDLMAQRLGELVERGPMRG